MDFTVGRGNGGVAARLIVRLLLVGISLAQVLSAETYTLRWVDNSTEETGFRIERAGSDGVFAAVGTAAADATSYADATAQAGVAYQYRVAAFSVSGLSAYSNVVRPPVAPTISAIPNQSTTPGTPVGPISFSVSDADTPATNLIVGAASSNEALIPNTGIALGNMGATRTVTVCPSAGQTGLVNITVTVSDGTLTRNAVFAVNVTSAPPNTAPTISPIADLTIPRAGWTGPRPFTIGDAQTPASSLTLRAISSNTQLLPLVGITFGGTGTKRTVSARPVVTRTGVVTVTVIVSDGTLTTSEDFVLTVQDPLLQATSTTLVAARSADKELASPVRSGSALAEQAIDLTRVGTVTASQAVSAAFEVEETPKTLLVRAVGPGLAAVGARETIGAPRIQILDAGERVVHESGAWGGNALVAAAAARLGKLPLAARSADAATLVTLDPGSYIVQVNGTRGEGGVVLLEVSEVIGTPATPGVLRAPRLR